MLLNKGKKKKEKIPKTEYYDSKREYILNYSEARRNLFGSKVDKKEKK